MSTPALETVKWFDLSSYGLTLMLMRGAVAAERLGVAAAYIEAMIQGMWEQGLKLDDPAALGAAIAAAGLPARELFELAQDQGVKDELAAGTLVEIVTIPGLAEDFHAITQRRRFPNPLLAELLAP